jgi:hypothetical protein
MDFRTTKGLCQKGRNNRVCSCSVADETQNDMRSVQKVMRTNGFCFVYKRKLVMGKMGTNPGI